MSRSLEHTKAYNFLRTFNITWISIAGRKGAGKDTYADAIADALEAQYPILQATNQRSATLLNYKGAEPIKTYVSRMFDWSREDLESYEFKETVCPCWGFTPRSALQTLSENFLKKLNPHFMQDYAVGYLSRVLERRDPKLPVYIIISDTRFAVECNWLQSMADSCEEHTYHSLRIQRVGGDDDAHVSEVPLHHDLIHLNIKNDGPLDHVPSVIRDVLESLGIRKPKCDIQLSASDKGLIQRLILDRLVCADSNQSFDDALIALREKLQ